MPRVALLKTKPNKQWLYKRPWYSWMSRIIPTNQSARWYLIIPYLCRSQARSEKRVAASCMREWKVHQLQSNLSIHTGLPFSSSLSNQSNHFYCHNHHSTSALVSEILKSVLQTVQKNNNSLYMDSTYLQTVQKTMCKIHIHILSTHSVL